MKHKPDDRSDNAKRIQRNINNTIENTELAEEMIAKTNNEKMKSELMDKNERRRDTLKDMKKEIRDEAIAKEKGYH